MHTQKTSPRASHGRGATTGECPPGQGMDSIMANIETWLKFDSDADEEPSHAAEIFKDSRGDWLVGWWNEAVGIVTYREFGTRALAAEWLEAGGYQDFTA